MLKQLLRRSSNPTSVPESSPAAAAVPGVTPLDVTEYTLSDAEYRLLRELVEESAQHHGPIIEIGTLLGLTATRMALWKQPAQKIIAVDNFCWNGWGLTPEQHYQAARHMLYYLTETGHVELQRIDKQEFFDTYDGPAPSLVFLDAWHTYEETKKDIDWALSVGAKIVSGHDYSHELWPGVVQAVDESGGAARLADSVWALPTE